MRIRETPTRARSRPSHQPPGPYKVRAAIGGARREEKCSRPCRRARRVGRQGPAHREWPNVDRKSTRLNSSHSQNSYAAFRLKKKKEQSNNVQIASEQTTENMARRQKYRRENQYC